MKKAIAIVLAVLLLAGTFCLGYETGRYKPGYELEKSSVYSDEDILKCAKLVEKDFRCFSEVKRYPVKIYYSDKSLYFARTFLGRIDGVDKVENILIIEADYLTGKVTQAEEPYSYSTAWQFVFCRKDSNSPWELYDQGCA